MSKKSYKRNQNRLYREIKRRLIAESRLRAPIKPIIQTVKTDKIRIKDQISYDIVYYGDVNTLEELSNHIIKDLARRLADDLVDKKYIEFYSTCDDDEQVVKFMAEIEVVRREGI